MQNHYTINVALKGNHLFATADHSLVTLEKAEQLFNDFKERFPASQGYHLEMTYWEVSGRRLTNRASLHEVKF